MKTIDLLLHADWVLTMENDKVLANHSVAIHQGKIVAVLPQSEATEQFQANDEQHLEQHVLMPGLINAHTHTPMNLFRGLADDLELMDWLNNYIWPAEKAVINARSVEVGTRLAIAEMIRGGTTCFSDHYFFPANIAAVADKEGMRATVGHVIMNVPTDWANDEDGYLSKAEVLLEQGNPSDRIQWSMAPHAPYTNSDSSLAKAKMLADRHNTVNHIHLHETESEIDISMGSHNKRPIARLDDIGLIDERLVAVHMTAMTDDEISLIAKRGSSVAHCPESNMKLASGFAPIQRMLDAGINVALGTDGAASNNDLDMFGEMRTAAFIGKGFSQDCTALPVYSILKMATINGAKALGIDDVTGSLSAGKSADLIAVDLSDYCAFPVYNPMSHLVYSTNCRQVKSVWVAGKQLLNNGELTQLDINATMNSAREFIDSICQLEHLRPCEA